MNISGLSAAANRTAIPSAKLNQLSSGLVVKQDNTNSRQTNLLTKSLCASDNNYTKEDAILKQWNKQGSFNLNDVMNGGTVKLIDPNPSAETLQEFAKQLQTDGIAKEVDWSGLKFDLRGIGFDADAAAYTIGADDFSRKVDYLASRYAAVEDKIKNTTASDAQAEQLQKLDEIYQNALSEIADGYSSIISSFLEKNGVSGEKEKIYFSIVSGVETKIEEYRRSLSDNTTLESLKGTADQWLLDDDAYVASVLRESAKGSATVSANNASAPYTLADLDALGQYASELSALEKPHNTNIYNLDEARIGLDFAMLAMKTDAVRSSGRISSAMSALLQKTQDSFMQSFLNRLDSQLNTARKENLGVGDKAGLAALDRNTVWDVYNHTMQQYRKDGDVMQALIKGAKYGTAKASAQALNGTYRYKNNASYWSNFFNSSTGSNSLNTYNKSASTFQKYLAGWLDFNDSLNSGDSVRLNLILKSNYQYMTSTISLFNKNI